MKTPICVLHYNDILHITVGSAIQQVDILFACVRHLGFVSATQCTCGYKTLLSDEQFLYLLPKPALVLVVQVPGNLCERVREETGVS